MEKVNKIERVETKQKEEDKTTNSTYLYPPIKISGTASSYISKIFKDIVNRKKYQDFCSKDVK